MKGTGYYDENSLWLHGEEDLAAPDGDFSETLNKPTRSVSAAIPGMVTRALAADPAPAQAAAVAVGTALASQNISLYLDGDEPIYNVVGGHTFKNGQISSLVFNEQGDIPPGLMAESFGVFVMEDDEWAEGVVDNRGRVLRGWRRDGTEYPDATAAGTGNGRKTAVFALLGQSNMVGRAQPYSLALDPTHPRVFEFKGGVLVQASEPLTHLGTDGTPGVGPGFHFAKLWADEHPDYDVVLVPAAWGGTGFTAASTADGQPNPRRWAVGTADENNLAMMAKAKIQAAIAACAAAGRIPSFEAVLWHQGESDTGLTEAQYAGHLDALIDWLRAGFGLPNLPFVVGQMNPENIDAIPGRIQIARAHVNTPRRKTYTGYARIDYGGHMDGDLTHLNRVNQRRLAISYLAELQRARQNTPESSAFEAQQLTARRVGSAARVAWQPPAGRVTDYTVEWRSGGAWSAASVTRDTYLSTTATITGIPADVIEVRVTTLIDASASLPVVYTL